MTHAPKTTLAQFVALDDATISFNFDGLGRMRSTGELICILLAMEDEGSRAGILADAMQRLGITVDDIQECHRPSCSGCGMAPDLCDCEVSRV
jgi:hypothetical protein